MRRVASTMNQSLPAAAAATHAAEAAAAAFCAVTALRAAEQEEQTGERDERERQVAEQARVVALLLVALGHGDVHAVLGQNVVAQVGREQNV